MKRYKINLKAVIPTIMLSLLVGFAWGARTEKDIQRVVALTPTSSVDVMTVDIPTATPTITPVAKLVVTPTPEPTIEPIGYETYRATAYCACAKCCGKSDGITASGEKAKEGVTIAADWKVLPKGTEVDIEGLGSRTVQDRGGAIKGRRIDVFMSSHEKALEFGVQDVLLTVRRVRTESKTLQPSKTSSQLFTIK